jgi:hypothetical protein
VNALDRAQRDEAAGDLGSARRRLLSFVRNQGFDAAACEQVARLSMRMGDPEEAGRWYFVCESSDPESQAAIERFRARHGPHARQLLLALPRFARYGSRATLPPQVAARLSELGPPFDEPPAKPKADWWDQAFGWGCALVVLVGVVSLCVGIVTIARWIINLSG